jgi:hypothetical protein
MRRKAVNHAPSKRRQLPLRFGAHDAETPRVHHEADTCDIRDDARERVFVHIARAGWTHRHEAALVLCPECSLPTAIRRAQRVLHAAVANRLLQRRVVTGNASIYGLTQLGAQWLFDERGIDVRPTLTALHEASRIEHRRRATQIVIAGELLGARGEHEREIYQQAGSLRQSFKKIPDATLRWTEQGRVLKTWHEIDISPRRGADAANMIAAVNLMASSSGIMDASGTQLHALVFHVAPGAPTRLLLMQLRANAMEMGWPGAEEFGLKASNAKRLLLQAPGFMIVVDPLQPIDWWPLRDSWLMPWTPGYGAPLLPFQSSWGPRLATQGPLVALAR